MIEYGGNQTGRDYGDDFRRSFLIWEFEPNDGSHDPRLLGVGLTDARGARG
jgi:hypothetical protein